MTLRQAWAETRLRFVVRLNPSKSELAGTGPDAEVSFLPMEAIGDDGSLRLDASRPLGEVQSGYSYFRDGDVVVAKITPCFENGKGALMRGLLGGVGFGTTELIVARPTPGVVDGAFLNWLFQTPDFRRVGEGAMYGAGGQKRVPDDFVRDYRVALPPLAEQAAIAAFLDRETGKIDALVEEQRRLIELLKEKRQAVISHAVTKGLDPNVKMKPSGVEWLGEVPAHWEVTQLKQLVDVLSGYAFPSQGFSGDETDTKLLRGINVAVGRTRWDEVVYWQRSQGDALDNFVLRAGDVVLGMDRPWIDEGLRVAQLREADLPALLLQRVAAVRPKSDLLPEHLVRLLESGAFFHHCFPEMTGVSVPHISPTQVGTFVVAVPPMEEQRRIETYLVAEVDKIDALVAAAQATIGLLGERRSALISAAVTGKIDVGVATATESEAA